MDLRTYLETSGTSQSEFARRIKVPPALVWQWINGRRPIAAKHAIPIERESGGLCPRHETCPEVFPAEEESRVA